MIYIVMGVSGSGKTTIGALLAKRLGIIFADADDYHPQANKDKMASGHPLDDADRKPWLESLNRLMLGWVADGKDAVLACSALKETHRAILSKDLPPTGIEFVQLDVPKEVLAARLAARKHPFMNPALLDSQLATLELPAGPNVFRVLNDKEPEAVVSEIVDGVRADSHGAASAIREGK